VTLSQIIDAEKPLRLSCFVAGWHIQCFNLVDPVANLAHDKAALLMVQGVSNLNNGAAISTFQIPEQNKE